MPWRHIARRARNRDISPLSYSRIRCIVRNWCLLLAASVAVFGARLPAQDSTGALSTEAAVGQSLRPGDIIRLRIWREPDLSGDFPIDQSGVATLPKLGPIEATATSPDSLRHLIRDGYTKYLAQTSIEITFLRRIQVTGAVKTPGLYPADPTMTVGDVIALAGGITSDGNAKKVELIRDGKTVSGNLDQGLRLSATALQSGDQLRVPYRSWLSRNGYLAGTLVSAAITLVYVFVKR